MAKTKAGLPQFDAADGTHVFAAQIEAMEPFNARGAPQGSTVLWFAGRAKKANLIGDWVREHNPTVGGYFAIDVSADGQTTCRHIPQVEFESTYTRAT